MNRTLKIALLGIQKAIDRPLYRIFWWPVWMLISVPCAIGIMLGIAFPIWTLPGVEAWVGLFGIVSSAMRLSTNMEALRNQPIKRRSILMGLSSSIVLTAYFLGLVLIKNVQPGISIYSGALVFGLLLLIGTIKLTD